METCETAHLTDDQVRALLEQQKQVIHALLQTREMLTHQVEEANSGLAQQMAALQMAEQPGTGRKKRRDFSTSDDDMRTSSATHDSRAMSSSGAVDRASSTDDFDEGNEDDEIVYRSCGPEMNSFSAAEEAQWQYEEAQRQNEEAQRQNCDEQAEILSQISRELATSRDEQTTDYTRMSATMTRLLELSKRLSAAREVSKALMGEGAGEEAAGDHQMGPLGAF